MEKHELSKIELAFGTSRHRSQAHPSRVVRRKAVDNLALDKCLPRHLVLGARRI
jgi:hypothetical protein